MNKLFSAALLLAFSTAPAYASLMAGMAPGPILAAPDNDLCTNVTPASLAIGGELIFIGDNTEATFTGDAVPGNVMSQFPSPNTWHAFTTTACAKVTVSYCATSSGWSNIWPLLTTDCPADSLIMANTLDTTTCANGNWTFTFTTLAPGTYYLPVPNVGFGQGGGAYNISVTAEACAINGTDQCGDAIPEALALGTSLTFNGDNTNASFDGDALPGNVMSQFPFANTWHAFTTTDCADVTVSYCATDSGWSNVWKLLSVHCPADSLIFATTEDTTTCATGNWTFTFNALAPGTYYLPVPNVGFGQGGGAYSIAVTAAACANAAPANDHCTDVTPQALASGELITFAGDNTHATFNGDAASGNVVSQYPFPNTWHAFTTTTCLDVTMSYCATDSGWSNVWKLLSVQCPADSLIMATAQDTTTCANGNWTFAFDHLEAGTYYLPVPNVGFGQGGGAYNIQVSASTCTVGLASLDGRSNAGWTLYPNPTNGAVTVTTPNAAGPATLELLDMTGRIITGQQVQLTTGGSLQLSFAITPGAYLLRLTTENGRSTQRLVVQ